ncbi:DUF4246 family protein [Candidatus Bathyarchaeota archaeon]|nr:DUF4246 family protein [Candidatus Bathyarchaeota archaeon]
MVQNLVDPSLYPLVRGRTRGFRGCRYRVVGVADAIERWAGKGDLDVIRTLRDNPRFPIKQHAKSTWWWSTDYQILPSQVRFVEGGGVEFASYINNLHPVKYRGIYRTVEQLIEAVLPARDLCLTWYDKSDNLRGPGRIEPRIPPPGEDDK